MEHLAFYIFLLSIGGSFVMRVTGFGFGIFIMTMLPLLMPSYGEATTLSGLLAMSTSVIIVYKMRRYLDWRKLLPILLTFMIVSTAAIFCLKRMDDVQLRRILGVVLVLISLYFIFFSGRIRIPSTLPWQIGAGSLSGLMGGFFGMQGPPAVLYFVSSVNDKKQYLALIQTYLMCGNISMTLFRAYNGFFTKTVAVDYLYGLGGIVVGAALGTWVFNRLSNGVFRYIVYAYIGLSGVLIFLTAH